LIAAFVVFPLAHWIPITAVHLDIIWWRLLTILPIASVLGAALGLSIGTRADPRKVPLIFGLVVIPITFLGATYYPWAVLTPIPWLKTVVLVNPLVYMSEGMRVSLTPYVEHMPLSGIRRDDPVHRAARRVGRLGVHKARADLTVVPAATSGGTTR
jgi:ABC-2 type transport system permease protein